jgi:hypothetical protein
MKTKILTEEPYGELLCSHINKRFPAVTKLTKFELVDVISNLIIGTKEIRYGSLPVPEHAIVIREAIRLAIEQNKPIPIVVPWGSIKADFSATLDIAELSAIQRLIQLSVTVKEYYPTGVEIVIRVEDTSGYTLFVLEGDQQKIISNIDSYSTDMKKLVQILSKDGSVRVQLESEMERALQFNKVFYELLPLMRRYLVNTWDMIKEYSSNVIKMHSYIALQQNGWKGIISWEQRMHYINTYERLYPNWSLDMYIERLALYFTGAWTRHQLGMTGKQEYWDKFIQLAFIPPIKGLPEGYNYNYVYHRTLPLSEARTHISPWRAKGYLKINGNEIHHKLLTFGDTETIGRLIPVQIEISDESSDAKVVINADYLLES